MADFEQLRHVDLCSGIGGFALGFERAGLSYPVLFCDIEKWCRDVLDKHWPAVPKATDVKELANDPEGLVPDCDIITAGYPCQPFSFAGQRKGQEDDRHIWPYILQIVAQKRPTWCVFENVYGHISLGLDEVLFDLEAESYAARAFIVPACATDAPHRRDRVWIVARNVADADNPRQSSSQGNRQNGGNRQRNNIGWSGKDVADANSKRGCGRNAKRENATPTRQSPCNQRDNTRGMETWLPEPDVGRVAHGIPRRVDRLKGLGNAIVPQIAEKIATTIKQVG